jgi:Carboxypeptidase regulatory-like domain
MKRMRTKTRRKKRTSGSKPILGRSLLALAFLAALLCPAAFSAQKDKSKQASAPFALIAGTVYRPPGFALPSAKVVIAPETPEVNGVKLKKSEVVTNGRGEFAVRVPPVPAKWRVDVKSNGYRPEQRSVTVEGEQRFDLSIVLEPARESKETQ